MSPEQIEKELMLVRPAQRDALRKFYEAVELRKKAKRDYDQAMTKCLDAGISNVRMGSVAGVSETAIRMYRARKKL